MKTILTMISAGLLFVATSCNKTQDIQPATTDNSSVSSQQRTENLDGRLDSRTVFFNNNRYAVLTQAYDARVEVPEVAVPGTAGTTINTMYVIKESVPLGTAPRFIAIIDALPGSNFTARTLWREVILTFTTDKLFQFTSAAEISAALNVPNSQLLVTKTNYYFEMQMAPLEMQPAAIQ